MQRNFVRSAVRFRDFFLSFFFAVKDTSIAVYWHQKEKNQNWQLRSNRFSLALKSNYAKDVRIDKKWINRSRTALKMWPIQNAKRVRRTNLRRVQDVKSKIFLFLVARATTQPIIAYDFEFAMHLSISHRTTQSEKGRKRGHTHTQTEIKYTPWINRFAFECDGALSILVRFTINIFFQSLFSRRERAHAHVVATITDIAIRQIAKRINILGMFERTSQTKKLKNYD